MEALKYELESNERILRDFGEQAGKTWRSSTILLKNGCRIDTTGNGQKLRGRRNYERRPDLILCDDNENDEGSGRRSSGRKRRTGLGRRYANRGTAIQTS